MDIEDKLSKLHAKCVACPSFNQNHLKTFLKVVQNLMQDERPTVKYLMKNGLAEMMEELYQKVLRAVSDGTAGAEALLDEVMDCVNNIGDLGPTEKYVMVEKFATKLLRIILMDMCSFPTKLELLKMLNNLLEGSTVASREYLQSCKEVPQLLDSLAALLFTIGDYEFQVCIIEALFRFITKAERPRAASKWFSGHLQLYPELMKVRDQFFETDCRMFLNVLNSSLPQRVVSCPCKLAFIGDYELKKPDDQLYSQFLVDFNLGSQRITMFCNQEPTESQEGEEGFWETVSISKEKIRSFKIEESNHKTVEITLTVPGHQIISFGPRNLSNKMLCHFDRRYSVEDWMEIVCQKRDKGKVVPQVKVSKAINPVAVEMINDYAEPESIPESQYSQRSVHNSQRDDKFLHPKDCVTSTQRSSTKTQGTRRKMSVPCQLMSTPTRTTIDKTCSPTSTQNPTPATSSDKPTSHKVKMSVTTMPLCKKAMEPNCSKHSKERPHKAKECGGSTPKTPTKKEKTPKKVKTPLIMVPTHPTNGSGDIETKQTSSGRSTRRSQTSRSEDKSVAEALPDPKPVPRNLSASPIGKKLGGKAEVSCNEMKSQLEQQMEQITVGLHSNHGDIEIVPESQPFTTDFTDPKQTSLEQKKSMLNDLKALLHQNDNFADYLKMVPKVAESPALSTVTEESCSRFSKTVTTPTNSQKTHLTSIPEKDDNTDEDVPDNKSQSLDSPIISRPVENNKQRKCSKNVEATDAIDTADIDGDEDEEGRDEIKSKKQRAARSKRRPAKSSSQESQESDSDCEIVEKKPTRSRKKKAETKDSDDKGKEYASTRSTRGSMRFSPKNYKEIEGDSDIADDPKPTKSQKQKSEKGGRGKEVVSAGSKSVSPKSAQDEDVVEVVMDSEVSSNQGNDVPTTLKKPLEKRSNGRKGNANVSKAKAMYNEFGFNSNDEDKSSPKDKRLNDSQDEFSARIERISGKKNVPEKAPRFFKARARERMNASQLDRSNVELESKETKGKAKPGKKGRKPQKPGMNFTNYLEFKKPRDRGGSSQSPQSEKEESQTYEFPETTGTTVDKRRKGPQKQKEEKAEAVIEYPSDKIKKDARKSRSPMSEEEPIKSVPAPSDKVPEVKVPEVKSGRKSLKKKNEDDGEFGPVDDDTSRSRRGKKKETEDITDARQDKMAKQKKSKKADNDDDDWEFPSVPSPTAEKNRSRSRGKKDNKECDNWEFPAPPALSAENDTRDNRSRSKRRGREQPSPEVDLGDAFNNTIAKIKKKIKDAAPKKCEEEEIAELSPRSKSDYDLGSVRGDSSDEEELGGALLHYDSTAEASTLKFRQTDLERKNLCDKKNKGDEHTNIPTKPGKDGQKTKKTISNERRSEPRKIASSESEDNEDDNSCTMDTSNDIINPKIAEGLTNLAKKYNSLLTTASSDTASHPSGLREKKTSAADMRQSRKKVDHHEASESKSDIGSMKSFRPKSSSKSGGRKFNLFRPDNQVLYTPDDQVITNNNKKMERNVFTDHSDTRSEASWLSSTNRKKEKKKPARTYGQGKKAAKRGKLQPGHSLFFDEETEQVTENEPKAKGKRGCKKSTNEKQPEKRQRTRRGKRSKSPEPANHRLYETNFPTEVIYTPLDSLLIEDHDKPESPIKRADVFSVRTPRYGKGKQFKPLEMTVTPVTPTSASRMELEDDEISIEEFRSAPRDSDIMAMPSQISPDIMKMKDSDSSEAEDVESPEVIQEALSAGSGFSHISNIKTSKTQSTREVEADLSDEGPELEFEDFSPLPFNMPKSGPSLTIRQQKRGVKRNLPGSDDEEEEDDDDEEEEDNDEDEEDEEEEEDASSELSTVNYTEKETVQVSFYQPRKLFKSDDEGDTGLDDVVSSNDSLPMDNDSSLQAIPAVIKSFGAEFQKKYSSRKEKLEQFSKNTLRSAHKQVDKFWNHQQTSRQRMVDSFTQEILLELTELEKDIDNLKHAENESVEFLKTHLNTLETCRISQEQRIKNLKRKHLNFDGEQRQLETTQADQQQNVREILRKELQTMQKKIMVQSQKEEMMNVKRTLQMMFQ